MAVIKLVEDYAVASLRNDVRDSLTLAGEQVILLQLYHAGDQTAVRCPQCGDDFYKSPEVNCTSCYGTTFDGGVREAKRVWALFTDDEWDEHLGPKGSYIPDVRSVQTEAFPLLLEHDVIVRVLNWGDDGTPETVLSYYVLQKVTRRSLRTGSRVGQLAHDVVSQKAQVGGLPNGAPLTRYPIVGQHFDLITVGQTTPPSAVVAADTKVVYFPFPFETAPGGMLAPVRGTRTFSRTIGDDVNTVFVISHNFGTRDVDVTVYRVSTGEEVDPDIAHTSDNDVTVTFRTAPDTDAYRVVVVGS